MELLSFVRDYLDIGEQKALLFQSVARQLLATVDLFAFWSK
jgi:hypothetical protein